MRNAVSHNPGISVSPIHLSVVFFVGLLAAMSALSAVLINRFVPREKRVGLRPMTQPTLTVVGMMFSMLLGFFIAQALREYSLASVTIVNEADSVGEVFQDAKGLGASDRKRIRWLCRDYVDVVVNEEWKMLAAGKSSIKAQAIMNELWEASLSVSPRDARETVVYDAYLRAMDELGGYRRVRVATNHHGLASHVWAIIATGGAAIVALTFLFAPDSKAFHTAILCCLLIPLTLNIFLLSEFSTPFSGLIHIEPEVFKDLQKNLFVDDDNAPLFLH